MRNWKPLLIAHFLLISTSAHAADLSPVDILPTPGPPAPSATDPRWESVTIESAEPPLFAPQVIDSEQLRLKADESLGDILQSQAGLQVLTAGGPGQQTSVSIRGSGTDQVLVLVDGIRINNVLSPSASFDFSDIGIANIERIEIYRGAECIRFGPDAIGGVINIITKTGAGPLSGSGFVEIGSYVTQTESAQASGSIGPFSYAIGGTTFQTQGFSAADQSLGNAERDGSTLAAFSSHLGWDLQSAGQLNFYWRTDDTTTDLDDAGGPHGDDPNDRARFHQSTLGFSWKTAQGPSPWQSEILLADSSVESSDRNLPDVNNPTDSADHFRSESRQLLIRSSWKFDEAFRAQILLDGRRDQGSSQSVLNGASASFPQVSADNVGEALMVFWDPTLWNLEAGLRHDEFNSDFQSWNYSASLGRNFWERSLKISARTFSGFMAPSLYELYGPYGDADLSSQTVQGWEIQVQVRSENKSLTFSEFDSIYRNLIDFNPTTLKYLNIDAARTTGFDLEGVWPLADSLLEVRPYWQHVRPTDESTGLDLLRRSRDQAGLELHSDLGNVKVSLQYLWVGPRDDIDPVGFFRVRMPAYDLWNLNSLVDLAHDYQLRLKLLNIFDKHYEEIDGYGTAGVGLYVGIQGNFH